jgi:hypothetical protein
LRWLRSQAVNIADVVGLTAALGAKADLASPTFTGTPAGPTAAPGLSTTQLATTAFVTAADVALVGGAPTGLNTLGKISTAIGGDAAFAATTSTALGAKAPLASPVFTGVPAGPTAANGTNTTQLATTAFVLANAVGGGGAPLNSPAFTGVPTAPTAAAGTATGQLATTLFVGNADAAILGGAPGSLNTLGKLATALGNDPAYATTNTTALADKQPLHANLTAESGLTGAADQVAYYTAAGTKALTSFTATGRGVAGLSSGQALRRYADRGLTTLTDAATIVSDGAVATVWSVTISGNRVIAIPTNTQQGATYTWIIINDGTAGRTTTLASGFRLPSGVSWTPDTGANKINVLTAITTASGVLLVVPATGFSP